MNRLSILFVSTAALFAVAGDYHLKLYGDLRQWRNLVACLLLWEVCAMMWVFAQRENIPLARSTLFGASIVGSLNILIGVTVFRETMSASQWVGCVCALLGMILLA